MSIIVASSLSFITDEADAKLLPLAKVLNEVPGFQVGSFVNSDLVSGQWNIWIKVKDVESLNRFLWAGCYRYFWLNNFSPWKMMCYTGDPDRDASFMTFVLACSKEGITELEKEGYTIDKFVSDIRDFIREYPHE